MLKRTINITLIIATVLIYGAIFYKAFWPKKVEDNINSQIITNNHSLVKNIVTKDTFQLILNERDPFKASSKKAYQKKENANNLQKVVKFKAKSSENIKWPKINYYGFVKNQLNESKLVLIKVNNKIFKEREGSTLDGEIKILRAFSDSLIISLNGLNKTLHREL